MLGAGVRRFSGQNDVRGDVVDDPVDFRGNVRQLHLGR